MEEMDDHTTTLADIKSQLRQFVRERDWEQYHFPKDLAIGLSIEAAELLEHFRFRSNDEIARRLQDEDFLREVGHELADVLYFVLLMCNNLGLDATRTLGEKLALSAARYPVDQARGKNLKYTELDNQKGNQE
jgi:dCTP diphosphatase